MQVKLSFKMHCSDRKAQLVYASTSIGCVCNQLGMLVIVSGTSDLCTCSAMRYQPVTESTVNM